MSTAEFAAFSDNAIMFASIVYVLAFLAHLTEWVFLRSVPVPVEERESALVGAPSTELSAGSGAPATSSTPCRCPATSRTTWTRRSATDRSSSASSTSRSCPRTTRSDDEDDD